MMKFSMRAIPAAAAIMAALVLGTQVYAQTPSPAAGDMQTMSPQNGAMPGAAQQGGSAMPMGPSGMMNKSNKSNTPKATADEETSAPGSIQKRNAGKQPMQQSRQSGMSNKSNTPKPTADEETSAPGSVQKHNPGNQSMRQSGQSGMSNNMSGSHKPRPDQGTDNPGANSGK